MAPKLDIFYSRGRSMFVSPSQWMIDLSDNERDPEYFLPGTLTSTPAAKDTRNTPKKVATGAVTTS